MLILGAGPAGSAAAKLLVDSGHQVVIVDQRAFPRDKVCGDGLISDALGALMILGADDTVLREAFRGDELRVYAPAGHHVSVSGEFACLPRARLDALLLDSATAAGARFSVATAIAPLLNDNRIAGARLRCEDGEVDVAARFTILATGSNVTVLEAFGLSAPPKPDAVAGRAYYQATPDVAAQVRHLSIAFDRRWCPGYGWVFPGPDNRFNIGVGLFGREGEHGRLREYFDEFCRTFPIAAMILKSATPVGEFRGAPMRNGLQQAQFGRPGLLAAGEAIAATYAATGEGIGKAMESGLMAAVLISETLMGERSADGVEQFYEYEFRRRFGSRYHAYQVGQHWAGKAWMLNLLARRANAGRFVRSELEALLAERGDASGLLSWSGLFRALVS